MAVFYYQTPEARERRVEKIITMLIENENKRRP
jgi:hypothetical protein